MARWEEIDFEQAVWKNPADRMKMDRIHQAPLPTQALEVLTELPALSCEATRETMQNSVSVAMRLRELEAQMEYLPH